MQITQSNDKIIPNASCEVNDVDESNCDLARCALEARNTHQ